MKIEIITSSHSFGAELYDTPTGRAVIDALPISALANTWGDEIYFSLSAQAALESEATDVVSVGDLAYWPPMPAFCIFFGPTPASIADEPRAADRVNVFGRLLDVDLAKLRSIRSGEAIMVKAVDRH